MTQAALARQPHLETSHQGKNNTPSRPGQPASSAKTVQKQTNPLVQRSTACPCGGGCPECASKSRAPVVTGRDLSLQAKLKIGAPGDKYEQEADHIADQVMQIPAGTRLNTSLPASQIQRACTNCKDKKDELIQTKPLSTGTSVTTAHNPVSLWQRIQAKPANHTSGGAMNGASIKLGANAASEFSSIQSGGRLMSPKERAFHEPRFGADFGHVRIHEGAKADHLAHSINARAFTLGNNIVFSSGEYSPGSGTGQRLMAHELVHVGQQTKEAIRRNTIQRIVKVLPGATAAADILSQFDHLCPSVFWGLSGNDITGTCVASSTHSCECLCDTVNDPARTYTINVGAVSNSPRTVTLHNGTSAIVPYPSNGPHTNIGANPTIFMPASTGNGIGFGAFNTSGGAIWAPNWRILAHELCGHGRLNQSYAGTKGNRPGHNSTIATENTIAAEHSGPARGKFSDVRQGESFHYQTGPTTDVVFKLVNGWHYEPP